MSGAAAFYDAADDLQIDSVDPFLEEVAATVARRLREYRDPVWPYDNNRPKTRRALPHSRPNWSADGTTIQNLTAHNGRPYASYVHGGLYETLIPRLILETLESQDAQDTLDQALPWSESA